MPNLLTSVLSVHIIEIMLRNSQRGFAHLFLLILLIAGVAIGIYLVQHPTFFKPHASGLQPSADSCKVSDPTSLKDCFLQAQENQTDNIEFTRMIDCIGPDVCKVLITRRGNPRTLTVYGTPGKNAGLHRGTRNTDRNSPEYKADSAYDVLVFIGSENITLKDLIFVEDKPYDTGENVRVIGSPLAFISGTDPNNNIIKSSNILVDNITMINAKKLAVQFSGVSNLTVKNSKFIGSGVTGIWMDRANELTLAQLNVIAKSPDVVEEKMSHFVTIDNNFFVDTNTGAVNFIGIGSPENPNRLTRNFLVHNHSFPAFRDAAGGLVPGAQMVIERNKNSIIEGNVIKDGTMGLASQSRYTSGIETSDLMENIVIRGNIVTNNDGAGLFADYRDIPNWKVIGSTIKITGNEFSNNGYDAQTKATQIFDQVPRDSTNHFFNVIPDNCFLAHCGHIQMGKIYADTLPCIIPSGGDTCHTTLHWYTNDPDGAVQVRVLENPGSVVGTTENGQSDISWISQTGATFELYAGNVKLDSVHVNGQSDITPVSSGDAKRKADIESIKNAVVAVKAAKGGWCATYSCTWDSPANNATYGMEGTDSISMKAALVTPGYLSAGLHDPNCPGGTCSNWNDYYLSIANDNQIKIYAKLETDLGDSTCPTQPPFYNYCISVPAASVDSTSNKDNSTNSVSSKPAATLALILASDTKRKDDLANIKKAFNSVKAAKKGWCVAYGCPWSSPADNVSYGVCKV